MVSNWLKVTHFEANVCVEIVPNDIPNDGDHKTNAAVGDENDPKELVKKPQVGPALVNETLVRKAYQDCPEYEVEESCVAEEDKKA